MAEAVLAAEVRTSPDRSFGAQGKRVCGVGTRTILARPTAHADAVHRQPSPVRQSSIRRRLSDAAARDQYRPPRYPAPATTAQLLRLCCRRNDGERGIDFGPVLREQAAVVALALCQACRARSQLEA